MASIKQLLIVSFIAQILFSSCTSSSNNKTQITEGDSYAVKYLNPLLKEGKLNQLEKQITLMRTHAIGNKYLLLQYYSIKQNQALSAKKMEQGILFADSLEILYKNVNKDFQKAFEMNYINSVCEKATILFTQHKYLQAYDIYYSVMEWQEQHRQPFVANFFLFNMGMNSYQQKLYDKAAYFFKKELETLATVSETDTLLNAQFKYYYTQQALSNIGLSYTKLNMLDSAYNYYQQALQYIDGAKNNAIKGFKLHEDDYHACLAVISGNLAKVYAKRGQVDSSVAAYKKSLYYTLDVPVSIPFFKRDTVDACLSLIQLSELYHNQKDYLNFKKSVKQLNELVPQNLSGHLLAINNDYVLGSFKINYWLNELEHNNKKAIFYLNRYLNYKDSLDLLQKEGTDKNIIQAFEIRTNEDKLNKLTLTNKINRLYIWGIVLIALVVSIAAILFYRSEKKEKRVNKLLSNLNNEIKQQQKETAFAYEQALEANKDKDKILHIVAHDLRNPLTGIATLADLILEEMEDDNQVEMLQAISSSSKRATQLVNDLVNTQHQKQEKIEFTKVCLNKLLFQLKPLFQHKAGEKNIDLTLNLPSTEIYVLANWSKLERVVSNLLHNAIKFCKNQGKVEIRLEQLDTKVFIHVEDNGIGMSENILTSLTNSKSSIVRDGTNGEKSYGLGWNICKQIVEAHNGKLLVTSKENKGTLVSIELEKF